MKIIRHHAGVVAADDLALAFENLLAEPKAVESQVLLQNLLKRKTCEPGQLPSHLLAFILGQTGAAQQGACVLAEGKLAGIRLRLHPVGLQIGRKFAMVMRHISKGGQPEHIGQVVAQGGVDGLVVQKPRHDLYAVQVHAVLRLEKPGQAATPDAAVAFAA